MKGWKSVRRHGQRREVAQPAKFQSRGQVLGGRILRVERPQLHHLYWPVLDVDLSLGSIEDPGRYPLKAVQD